MFLLCLWLFIIRVLETNRVGLFGNSIVISDRTFPLFFFRNVDWSANKFYCSLEDSRKFNIHRNVVFARSCLSSALVCVSLSRVPNSMDFQVNW